MNQYKSDKRNIQEHTNYNIKKISEKKDYKTKINKLKNKEVF